MLGEKPLLSIIIRAYNAEKTIERGIESVLNERAFSDNCELIIINDGSKDGTLEIVKSYESKSKIKIIDQKNCGAIVAANNGFKMAKGEWVLTLDADDYLVPSALEVFLETLQTNKDADLIYSDYFEGWNNDFKLVSPTNVFQCLSGGMIVKRKEIVKTGYWDIELVFPEYDMILKTWGDWRIVYVSKPLFYYCRQLDSLSTNPASFDNTINTLKLRYPDKLNLINNIRTY